MRLAIICDNERAWSLPTWAKTIPLLLKSGYDIRGLWVLKTKRSHRNFLWYKNRFGLSSVLKLALFSLVSYLFSVFPNFSSFKKMSSTNTVNIFNSDNVNSNEIQNWLKMEEIF